MSRWLVSGLVLGAMCVALVADDPKQAELAKKPQWQRMLTGEDAKKAEKLEKRIADLEAADDYEEAIKTSQELLALRKSVQGEDHYEWKSAEQDLFAIKKVALLAPKDRLIWRQATSRWREAQQLESKASYDVARKIRKEALDISRRVLGEHHSDTATRYSLLASNLEQSGMATEAEAMYRKTYDINRKALGEDHPATAISCGNLALNLDHQGKISEAAPLHRNVLTIFLTVIGEDNTNTATIFHNVAGNLREQGKSAEAEPFALKGLELRRKLLGDSHPDTATSYNNLAGNLNLQGKSAEADSLFRRALEIRRAVLSDDHPDTAASYNNVGFNLDALRRFAEAEPFARKALVLRQKLLGDGHPDTAGSYNNLAANLYAQGKSAEAELLHRKALDIYRRTHNEYHHHTAQSYSNLANALDAQGKLVEAELLHHKALDIDRKVYGEYHGTTTGHYYNFATNLIRQGKTDSAISILKSSVAGYESLRLHVALGVHRSNLAQTNPRLLLATLQAYKTPDVCWQQLEHSVARGMYDQQTKMSRLTTEEQRTQQDAQQRVAALQPRVLNLVTRSNRSASENQELQELLDQRRQHEETFTRLSVLDSERAIDPSERIQAALSADAAILYWVDVADNSGRVEEHWAGVARMEGEPKFVRLTGTGENGTWAKSDSQLPGELRLALANSGPFSEVETLSRRLHAQRIAPLLPHLVGVTTLHVVGVHEMAGIPIEALTSDFRIDYVPSGSYLARLSKQPQVTTQGLFALGDPVFPDIAPKTIAPPLPTGGILITQVVPGGAGDKVRLQPGDVLMKYGDKELASVDDLKTSITANEKAEKNTLTVWRDGKTNTKDVPPGKLGVVLDLEPAPVAIAARRKTDEQLAKLSRGGEWNELPGTAAELTGLQSLFPQNTILTRKDANPKKLAELVKADKLKEFRYLHFATHGEANSVMAFQSSLILHGDDKSVARLTAREILDTWKLNAELVTLSACETAIGKQGGGDGLLGFAQAFLTAGARSVCLSLWKVDDAATALLMDRFYRNLLGKREGLDKPMPKALALDEAKRWLRTLSTEDAATRLATISKGVSRGAGAKAIELAPPKPAADAKPDGAKKPFDHPKYWAAFILIGDPN